MELEALQSIYGDDECFKEISPVSFQFRVSPGPPPSSSVTGTLRSGGSLLFA
uniref:RWD domain-containing protein n=1 Tax=Oryzias sinensis TaxID=183150 RepID=A0A8C7WVE5_9TELE